MGEDVIKGELVLPLVGFFFEKTMSSERTTISTHLRVKLSSHITISLLVFFFNFDAILFYFFKFFTFQVF